MTVNDLELDELVSRCILHGRMLGCCGRNVKAGIIGTGGGIMAAT